jgi:Ca2+-binding EF-hand superfamily protein
MQGCATLFLSKGDPRIKLDYIFNFYDANNDGYLNLKEIKEGYKALFSMLGNDNVDIICKQMAETAMSDLGSPEAKIKKGITIIFCIK